MTVGHTSLNLYLWNSFKPETDITWELYITLGIIFLFHSIDVAVTYVSITTGWADEGNKLVVMFFERFGLVFTLFLTWAIGIIVVIMVAKISLWLERTRHYFPVPSFLLLIFLVFTALIKIVAVIWNFSVLLG